MSQKNVVINEDKVMSLLRQANTAIQDSQRIFAFNYQRMNTITCGRKLRPQVKSMVDVDIYHMFSRSKELQCFQLY